MANQNIADQKEAQLEREILALEKQKKKMDQKLLAKKQTYEVYYLQKAYNIPTKLTRQVIKELNTPSRRRIYEELRSKHGYTNLPVK